MALVMNDFNVRLLGKVVLDPPLVITLCSMHRRVMRLVVFMCVLQKLGITSAPGELYRDTIRLSEKLPDQCSIQQLNVINAPNYPSMASLTATGLLLPCVQYAQRNS